MSLNVPARFRASGLAVVLAAASVSGACSTKLTETHRGTMAVQLTDAPFLTDSVARVDVHVVRVDARVADADSATAARGATDDSANTGGWITLASPGVLVNLLAYQNGAFLALGTASVPTGNYQAFRLIIDATKSSMTLKSGAKLTATSTPNVSFPSASRSGIKVNLSQAVTIVRDDTTTVLVDFDVANSFVLRGSSIALNGVIFKPVLRGTVRP